MPEARCAAAFIRGGICLAYQTGRRVLFCHVSPGRLFPQAVLLDFKRQQAEKIRKLCSGKVGAREDIDREFQRQVEEYLDRGIGECHLKRSEVAQIAAEALLHFHEKQYLLDDWVIMPNHVHLILWPMPNYTLSNILPRPKALYFT